MRNHLLVLLPLILPLKFTYTMRHDVKQFSDQQPLYQDRDAGVRFHWSDFSSLWTQKRRWFDPVCFVKNAFLRPCLLFS